MRLALLAALAGCGTKSEAPAPPRGQTIATWGVGKLDDQPVFFPVTVQ